MQYRYWFIVFCIVSIVLVGSRTGMAVSSNQHELSCKVMSVVATMVKAKSRINSDMLLFLVSNDYDKLPASEGKKSLGTADAASKVAYLLFNAQDEEKARAGLVIATVAVLEACSYYCFDECRNFCGDRQADDDDIKRATLLLTICGVASW